MTLMTPEVEHLCAAEGCVTGLAGSSRRDLKLPLGFVSVENFGGVGNWNGREGTDNFRALQSALDTGLHVFVPPGNYFYSGNLVFSNVAGQRLVGVGGVVERDNRSRIFCGSISGAALSLRKRSQGIFSIGIIGTDRRYDQGLNDGHGVAIIPPFPDNPGSRPGHFFYSFSRIQMNDVLISHHPADGFHAVGSLELALIENVTINGCGRHGFLHDSGEHSGLEFEYFGPFMVNYFRCRAFYCGGNGWLITGGPNSPPTGLNLSYCQALSCGWDIERRERAEQMLISGQQICLEMVDVEDIHFSNAHGARGKRARDKPSAGIYLRGRAIQVRNSTFGSLTQSIFVQSGSSEIEIIWPRITVGRYGVRQPVAIDVQSSTGVKFRGSKALAPGAEVLFRGQSPGADIVIDNRRFRGLSTAVLDFEQVEDSPDFVGPDRDGIVRIGSSMVRLRAASPGRVVRDFGLRGNVVPAVGMKVALLWDGDNECDFDPDGEGSTVSVGSIRTIGRAYPVWELIYTNKKWYASPRFGCIPDIRIIKLESRMGFSTIVSKLKFARTYELKVEGVENLSDFSVAVRIGRSPGDDTFLSEVTLTRGAVVGCVVRGSEYIDQRLILSWSGASREGEDSLCLTSVVK